MHIKIQCPLPRGLKPHCSCPRLSKLRHVPGAPYLAVQVSFDVLLHQLQQLRGGTVEVVRKESEFPGPVSWLTRTDSWDRSLCPQSAVQRRTSESMPCSGAEFEGWSPLPRRRSMSLREGGPSSQGLQAVKMVITEARLGGDSRQTSDLAKAHCGCFLSQLPQGLHRWAGMASRAGIPGLLVTLAPVPVML